MFSSIYLTHLRNNEFIQFMKNFLGILNEKDLEALKLKSKTDNLATLLISMTSLYKPDLGSQLTKNLQEDDERRDTALVGIQTAITAYTYHFDTETKESADLLAATLKKYGTGISKQNYQGETAIINSIIEEWKREEVFVTAINKLNLTDWIIELDTSNVRFNKNYLNRAKEDSEAPEVKIVDLRKQIIEAYRDLSNRVNAFATIGEVQTYSDIIKHGNSIIEKYNAVVNARTAKAVEEEETAQE